ncbi:MAG TPA: nucleoside triphosphate pyrophosphohydrolase [Terriglobales bacterium]
MSTGAKFERAAAIMHRLRAPGGCPWDREQTFDTIKPYTLEETYEVFEAIENRDWQELKGELGDLLLQVLFYAEMAQEAGHFSIDEVLDTLSDKLVRRHPHVFGDVEANHADQVLRNWERIKQEERGHDPDERKPLLASVSRNMPALQEAEKINKKAAKTGFDWPDAHGILDKIKEEADELSAELKEADRDRLEDEVGDLFFTVVNLARYLKIDSESALRRANAKFRSRFEAVERSAWATDRKLEDLTLEEMEQHWSEAKSKERHG